MKPRLRNTTVAFLLVLAAAMPLAAQTTAGLTGTASSQGSPLPGVTVTITSLSLQGTRTAVTGEAGTYNFPALPPGEYSVNFELSGMQPMTRRVQLQLGQTARADADLKMSGINEAITVTATAASVLETPQVATNIKQSEVEMLPMTGAEPRGQLQAALLAPGVNANTFSAQQLQISGSPGFDNLVLVNGVVVTENVRSQMRPLFVEDAIQETTVMTGSISAEYGRFTGGVVNTITKSGGNELSGSYRSSLSNQSWVAQSRALESRLDKVDMVHEGTLGGFVLRDRLWFFGAGRFAKGNVPATLVAVPACATCSPATAARPQITYSRNDDEKRYEGKLTGQITQSHSLQGSYFKIDSSSKNSRFTGANAYDLDSLTDRSDPESLLSAHYTGAISSSLLVEGQYSRRQQAFENNGSKFTDLVRGTILLDRNNSNTRFNSATFCGVCDTETRNNDQVAVKASYFLSSSRLGTHQLTAGADRFSEQRYANNFQSGSNFRVFVTRAVFNNGQIYPVITPTTATGGGTFIRWTPIFVNANANDLRTDSLFVNDKWDITDRWSLNLGVRYDKNNAVDGNGNVISKDSRITPRLGVYYDVRGNGRHRLSATVSDYASHIIEGVAGSMQSAGQPATVDFRYTGPAINSTTVNTTLAQAIEQMFAYFNTQQGGTGNTAAANLFPGGARSIPGYTNWFQDSLRTPYVREYTAGYGMQIGARGFAKVDLISRDWTDFYVAKQTQSGRRVTTPLGIPVDLDLITNSEDIERKYRGLQLQGRWTPKRYQFGFNYTYATLKGNAEVENAASGPGAVTDPDEFYPEYLAYSRRVPTGYLSGDQRHRIRAWAGMSIPIPESIGNLAVSVLQSLDSGLPYGIAGTINSFTAPGAAPGTNYNASTTSTYWFTNRDAFRTDDVHSTNFAVRLSRPLGRVEVFVNADVVNVFNNSDIADVTRVNTTVRTGWSATARDFATNQTLQRFNPFTDTPVKGVHYSVNEDRASASFFGSALSREAYQRPRTVRGSFGVRF